ncbi:uncharacterized protein LY79DRAFT_674995 [Colletotrichum navitas]|uniref:Uncharacterized protein n=1 Tax=Colletotrichum navitas TaxID=681940 RepID=A0AAD8UX54_9PEZI|nr:uncharacterized protein LY79DRAFT_674995 [Colletotrichum navitas]KAK1566028.1 hypothetical protein LY79DRAFT_674995 [Colletotrichum navitas]
MRSTGLLSCLAVLATPAPRQTGTRVQHKDTGDQQHLSRSLTYPDPRPDDHGPTFRVSAHYLRLGGHQFHYGVADILDLHLFGLGLVDCQYRSVPATQTDLHGAACPDVYLRRHIYVSHRANLRVVCTGPYHNLYNNSSPDVYLCHNLYDNSNPDVYLCHNLYDNSSPDVYLCHNIYDNSSPDVYLCHNLYNNSSPDVYLCHNLYDNSNPDVYLCQNLYDNSSPDVYLCHNLYDNSSPDVYLCHNIYVNYPDVYLCHNIYVNYPDVYLCHNIYVNYPDVYLCHNIYVNYPDVYLCHNIYDIRAASRGFHKVYEGDKVGSVGYYARSDSASEGVTGNYHHWCVDKCAADKQCKSVFIYRVLTTNGSTYQQNFFCDQFNLMWAENDLQKGVDVNDAGVAFSKDSKA